jgi:apolipoprotein D and lipocalin family protein
MTRWILCLTLGLAGCAGTPAFRDDAVRDFELERYLGTWHEIARLDHRFERNLSHVTAHYSLRPEGGVKVVNRGYNTRRQRWVSATGKAFAVDDATVGRLKVSFFGPFYSAYTVVALDASDYRYALVAGASHRYLWILAREPQLPDDIVAALVAEAQRLGFDTEALIFVEQAERPPDDPS